MALPHALRLGLLFSATLGVCASRNQDELMLDLDEDLSNYQRAPTIKSLVSAEDVICGGPEIWKMLTASSSVSSMMNVKWLKIDKFAEDYITEMQRKQSKLEIQVKALEERIGVKKEQERPTDASAEEIQELIKSSLAKFEGLEAAQRTKCGKPGQAPPAPRGAYRASIKDFEEKAGEFFSSKEKRLGGDVFLKECEALLPPEDRGSSYCGPLCQRFKDAAQDQSNKHVGAKGGVPSDELVKTHALKAEKLEKVKDEIEQCTTARESLATFGAHITELKQKYDKRFNEVMEAEMALDEAMYDLEDAEQNLEQNSKALEEAAEALKVATGNIESAKVAVAEAQTKVADLTTRVQAAEERLSTLRQELEAARMADKFVVDMKDTVSAVMMRMKLMYTQAILQPMGKVGLIEGLDLKEVFDPHGTEATDALGDAVDGLSTYCESTAPPVFEAVKESVDLTPLCAISEASVVKNEAIKAVEAKMAKIKKQLKELLRLHDFYGYSKKMTRELAENRVSKGEPAGLVEITGIFNRAKFFQKYLIEWRLGGKLLMQTEKLKALVERLTADVTAAKDEMTRLGEEQTAASTSVDEAIKKLEEAEAAQVGKPELKIELEAKVEELKAQNTQLKANFDDLERQLAEAREKWAQAEADLMEAYKAQVSLLQTDEDPMLRVEHEEKQRKLKLLRQQVAEARVELLEVEAKAREARQWSS